MRARGGPGRTAAAIVVVQALALLAVAPGPAGASAPPSLELLAPNTHLTVLHRPGGFAFVDPGFEITPAGGDFVLHVRRQDYASPMAVAQETTGGEMTLTSDVLDGWYGLAGFLRMKLTSSRTGRSTRWTVGFCPNSPDAQRIDPNAAAERTYPLQCPSNPFTLGSVWGIDDGWAVPALAQPVNVGDENGRYVLTASIAARDRDLFGIPTDQATRSVVIHVRTGTPSAAPITATSSAARRATPVRPAGPRAAVPADEPDLVPLPATAVFVQERNGHDVLRFDSTVWIGGNGPLEIQGFRRPDSNVMDAYQYFIGPGGSEDGSQPAGTLRFDAKTGHDHWHYQPFARYTLLDASADEVRASHKAGFCLEPSVGIDLLTTGAVYRPDLGTRTDCGTESSRWVREVLPVGWGDTYEEFLPGQSFDVTGLPNGEYRIRVEANPQGLLAETDTTNDVADRTVEILGKPGHRYVCVPAYGAGIDAEGRCSG